MHNEEAGIAPFFERVDEVLAGIECSYEIVCVNDGSTDATLARLIEHAACDPAVRVVDLSRNFGKEIALTAGLDHAVGQAVVPIDADLQDPPELIVDMLAQWRAGFEVVLAQRADRSSDTWLKRATANLFYRLMSVASETKLPPNVGDYRLMDRKVVDAIALLPERARFMKGVMAWVGFKTTTVTFKREARLTGTTSWRYWQLWNFALEGLVSFSTLPLRVWSYIGFMFALLSMSYIVVIVGRTLIYGVAVPGYASLLSIVLFFNGLFMVSLGVLGEYVGRVFVEVKARPLYLVRQRVGFDDSQGQPTAPATH